jgi:hypothetical protein
LRPPPDASETPENQLRVLKDPPERIKNLPEELSLILIDDGKKGVQNGLKSPRHRKETHQIIGNPQDLLERRQGMQDVFATLHGANIKCLYPDRQKLAQAPQMGRDVGRKSNFTLADFCSSCCVSNSSTLAYAPVQSRS